MFGSTCHKADSAQIWNTDPSSYRLTVICTAYVVTNINIILLHSTHLHAMNVQMVIQNKNDVMVAKIVTMAINMYTILVSLTNG